MIDIALYSLIQLLTAFSPNFAVFLVLRAIFGIAMGGEWGLGAALTMESLPAGRRGFYSGFLQQGYMVGYLLAALVYYLVFTFTHWDWRSLFIIGALPAGLILYIRSSVPESRVWLEQRAARLALPRSLLLKTFAAHWPLFVYTVAFMAALNATSHGTQDLYATFLQRQHGLGPSWVSTLSIIGAVGALFGCVAGGIVSERLGRRGVVMLCSALAMCTIPLWIFSPSLEMLALGVFIMQFGVQGSWGVIPAHLNELSPPEARGTFPGFTYQLGNLIAAGIVQIEAAIAQKMPLAAGGFNYAGAMAIVAAFVLACAFALAAVGHLICKENRRLSFAPTPSR
jgi:MFS transporter, SHS family, lactate transporter